MIFFLEKSIKKIGITVNVINISVKLEDAFEVFVAPVSKLNVLNSSARPTKKNPIWGPKLVKFHKLLIQLWLSLKLWL